MSCSLDRRSFLKSAAATGAALGLATVPGTALVAEEEASKKLFKISIAEWSFHRRIRAGQLDNLDFPAFTKNEFGLDCVEYVNVFFMDKAQDMTYLAELKQRCEDNGVTSGLIMCDREGALGNPDSVARKEAVENHYKWVEAAEFLGCHSIRVNAQSSGSYEQQQDYAADGLRQLCEFGAKHDMNIIVENHGGLSSNGAWLAGVMKKVNLPNCGTLPDFGNFQTSPGEWYDRYKGVRELMPYAKGVSAKSHEFDDEGNEVRTDYEKMLGIVLGAGYHGYIGIEYEGPDNDEVKGVRLTQQLLERLRDQMAAS